MSSVDLERAGGPRLRLAERPPPGNGRLPRVGGRILGGVVASVAAFVSASASAVRAGRPLPSLCCLRDLFYLIPMTYFPRSGEGGRSVRLSHIPFNSFSKIKSSPSGKQFLDNSFYP